MVQWCNRAFQSAGLNPQPILSSLSHCRQGTVAIQHPSRVKGVYSRRPFNYFPVLEYCTRCYENLNRMPEGRWEGYLDDSFSKLREVEIWNISLTWHHKFYTPTPDTALAVE